METEFEESAIEGFEKYLELEKEAVDEHLYLAILYDRLETETDEEYDANLQKAASHALRWKEKGGANPNWDLISAAMSKAMILPWGPSMLS